MDRIGPFSEQLAGCFTDHRNPLFVEHELPVLLRQRVMGIALGYEDINDHERLRLDPLLAAAKLDEDVVLCAKAAGANEPPEMDGNARVFAELRYRTRESWSRERRVAGKTELTNGKPDPRFMVTNIRTGEEWALGLEQFTDGASLYEKFYCGRGDMENRIKEQQPDLFADRTSTAHMKSNRLRLWLSTFAYMLMRRLRATGLAGTRLAKATAGTIRLHLMKIAARVTVSVRRIHVRLCGACPMMDVFAHAHGKLAAESG